VPKAKRKTQNYNSKLKGRSLIGVLLISLIFAFLLSGRPGPLSADQPDDQLQETQREIEQAKQQQARIKEELQETEKLEKELAGSITYYEFQLSTAQQRLLDLNKQIADKEREIALVEEEAANKEQDLKEQRKRIFEQIRVLYKTSFADPLEIYLLNSQKLDHLRLAVLHQAVIENLRLKIYLLGDQINQLNNQKQSLKTEAQTLKDDRDLLVKKKQQVQQSINQAQTKVLAAKTAQKQLMQDLAGINQKIQELTRKERQILAAKAAAALASTTVGEIEITRAAIESPPPEDGNVYFSFWTYGYPHRVGMNQYGAYGRAKAGQDFVQILKAYYKDITIEKQEMPEKITITTADGTVEEIPFEQDYLLGIAEMPSCWGSPANKGLEALKAQAVAARTYALKYTNGGKSPICIDQKCQVYIGKSKIEGLCGQYWKEAVEETAGMVITHNHELISAWYASTAGGFTLNSQDAWGTYTPYTQNIKDADSQGHFFDGPAWGDSPWFHKAWGSQPWLSRSQVEDLLNASLLPAGYDAHLPLPETDPDEGFSAEEVLATLQKEGISPIVNLKSLEVIGAETTSTLLIRAYYQDTYIDIDAQRFRFIYNLRSPATNAIWTSRFDIKTN